MDISNDYTNINFDIPDKYKFNEEINFKSLELLFDSINEVCGTEKELKGKMLVNISFTILFYIFLVYFFTRKIKKYISPPVEEVSTSSVEVINDSGRRISVRSVRRIKKSKSSRRRKSKSNSRRKKSKSRRRRPSKSGRRKY